MPQVTLYLDEDTVRKMKKAAKAAGLSQSRWLSDLVRKKVARVWPESVRRLAGAWTDLEGARNLRRGAGKDIPREPF